MSLETGTYLFNLVSSNPTGSDRKLQGDDHLRLIKSVLQNSFAGLTGAVIVGGPNGGAVNAYTLTPTPPLPSYVDNMSIVFSPVIANTGPVTMNVSGLGAVSLQSVSGAALVANDLIPGQRYRATFDGTNFRLFSITKNYVDQLSFSAALPAQSLGFLRSTGSVASFGTQHTGYAQDEVRGADIASASTVNLQTATGNLVHITGTTTINAVTLNAGAEREVVFDGILTLTNSANLILPTGANLTTAAGDVVTFRGEPSSVARVTKYTRADGKPLALTPLGDHEVVVHTGNGFGSTNTQIRRFTTTLTNVGTAITYADSATLGASFTINENGIYAITFVGQGGGAGVDTYVGISLNTNQPTTGIELITAANRLGVATATTFGSISRVQKLSIGDVIRPHCTLPGNAVNAQAATMFSIRKVNTP